MKNSLSDHSSFVESEGDKEKAFIGENGSGYDGNDSDLSDYSENDQPKKHGSFNTSWPQSYRKSLDLYSTVPSPSLGFLGSSPFLSSSGLRRKPTSESLDNASKPLLSSFSDVPAPDQRRSSLSQLPPLPTRKSSVRKDDKSSHISHGISLSRNCSFGQAVVNGVNILCGVGILSTPYAVKEGGLVGVSILLVFGILSFYTGLLLRRCLESGPGLETYPDIGQAAFGTVGRIIISIILYAELYALCVESIILESDNLSALFPNAHLSLVGFELDSHHLFALVVTLGFLPTVWLRDLSILSYLSVGGVAMSVLVVACLFWAGQVDGIGFHNSGTFLNLSTLPVAIGMYGFCYSGHAVFPNIYTSMANRNQFPYVLLTCFGICTVLYTGVAVMGYTMFGESIESQYTLNMPQHLIASKMAVYITVISPFTRFALTISPVALSLEELIPSSKRESHTYAICIRTLLVISTLIVGLCIPFFGLVMSLIGSLLTMLVTFILPCTCYLRILKGKVTRLQVVLCILIIGVGVVSSISGTYSAVSKIIDSLSG